MDLSALVVILLLHLQPTPRSHGHASSQEQHTVHKDTTLYPKLPLRLTLPFGS